MDFPFSILKRETFFKLLCVLFAQRWPQQAVALWRTGLLLSFLHICTCLEEECVLGVVGRPVSLPCFYPQLLTFKNFSIEWRKDDKVVLRSVFENGRNIEELSADGGTLSSNATEAGDFSLELPAVDPAEDKRNYGLFLISEANQSDALCTVCLRIAASFSRPLVRREEAADRGNDTGFYCHSAGGFPEPRVHWLINHTAEPPEGSVRTVAALLPDSYLYNITSYLKVNISKALSVSCGVENALLNETFTSTSYGTPPSKVAGRAAEAMWIFSTGLCAVVGVMVAVGVGYQIHLDRVSKRKKLEFQYQQNKRGYKRSRLTDDAESIVETEVTMVESKESNV
eukprot:XP_011612809.1 PREDICTED: ICOS ligand-like [Takifugu rubripes]